MQVRRATTNDLRAIMAIETASFGNPWPDDAYLQEIERDNGFVDVALEGSAVVGFSCTWHVAAGQPPDREVEAHLLRIAVANTHRGKGVGSDLLAALLAHAQVAGCYRVSLEVAAQNRIAITLYERAGFREIARRAGYYRVPPDDAILMFAELAVPNSQAGPP